MVATYPDLFQAGIAYAGVAAGCFYTGTVNGWNSTCAQGKSIATAEAWANTARNMRPGYTGSRPRMMIYHGATDSTVNPQNYREEIKQWAGIFGYAIPAGQTYQNQPASGFTKEVYGPNLQGNYHSTAGHGVPTVATEDMKWFGIPASNNPPVSSSATLSTSTSTRTSTTAQGNPSNPPGSCEAKQWEQCGGKTWGGCTVCVSGTTCQVENEWYHQCR